MLYWVWSLGVEDVALNLISLIIKQYLIKAKAYTYKVLINDLANESLKWIYVYKINTNVCRFRGIDFFSELVN